MADIGGEWRRDESSGDELRVVTHGVPSTLMVALPGGISPTQALAVVSYVWSVSNGKAKP